MGKYQSKHGEGPMSGAFDAIEITPELVSDETLMPDWAVSDVQYQMFENQPQTKKIFVNASFGATFAEVGSWITKDSEGEVLVWDGASFLDTFSPVQ